MSCFARLAFRNWRYFKSVDVDLEPNVFIVGSNASRGSNSVDDQRALVEAHLAVVERRLPEQLFERITAQRGFTKQPGTL